VDSDPLLTSATAEILQDKLCNREQHVSVHKISFIVYLWFMATSFDTTFRFVSLIIVFSTLFVLVFFSSVICLRVDIV